MRVIRTGRKAKPQPAMSEVEVLQGYWELESNLGLRSNPQDKLLLDIPRLYPVPLTEEELDL